MRRRNPEVVWHVCGTRIVRELIRPALPSGCWCCDLRFLVGAGEGNRTLMTSLEGRWCRDWPARGYVPAGPPGRVLVSDRQ